MAAMSPCEGMLPVAMVAASVSDTQQPPEDGPRMLNIFTNRTMVNTNTYVIRFSNNNT